MNIARMKKGLMTLCTILVLAACSTDFEDIPHVVTEVLDGNTLVLKNGTTVHLIGVADTPASKEYLTDKSLNQKVKIQFDRSKYPDVETEKEVWAYVKTLAGASLNGNILRLGYSRLERDFLTDSLQVYSSYSVPASNAVQEEIAIGPTVISKKPRIKPKTNSTSFTSFADVVEYAEQCVFLVLGKDEKGKTVSQGTGFFLAENGLCVSNYHVFEGGTEWFVRTANGTRYRVTEILDKDKDYDYIVFKIDLAEGEQYPYLQAAHTTPRKGTDIFVLGNPKGLESTITRGVISAVRDQGMKDAVLQIDAAISPGSSGSPVMTTDGKVVGIATYKARDCESCNFAMNVQVLGF